MAEKFGVSMKVSKDLRCKFYSLNKECLRKECPFYPWSVDKAEGIYG